MVAREPGGPELLDEDVRSSVEACAWEVLRYLEVRSSSTMMLSRATMLIVAKEKKRITLTVDLM
jgi:hypothetical protein